MPDRLDGIFLISGWGWLRPLLALVGAGVIVLLYMLRRRPNSFVVPSTLLWQQVVRDNVARRPWQRLRSRLSLWLELLAALALALALARPGFPGGPGVLHGAVWVLDATASMGAEDRWQQAVATIRDDLRRAGPNFRGALLRAGPEPRWLAGPGATAAEIAGVLDRPAGGASGPSGGTTDWRAVLALAYGAAGSLPPGSPVRVVTDGTDPTLAGQLAAPPPGPHPLEVTVTGSPVENTAILAVSPPGGGTPAAPAGGTPGAVREAPPGGTPAAGGPTVTLVHYGRERATVTVVVEPAAPAGTSAAGGQAGAAGSSGTVPPQRVTLEPGRPVQVTFAVPAGAPLYRVALVPGDAYPTDDVAWAVPGSRPAIRIGLLAQGEAGLIHRALALRPGAQVLRLVPPVGDEGASRVPPQRPGEEGLPPDALTGLDLLVVVGRPLSAELPESLPVIWIDPPAGPDGTGPAHARSDSGTASDSGSGTGSDSGSASDSGSRTGSDGGTGPGAGAVPGRPFQPRSLAVAGGGDAARLLSVVPLDGVTLLSARVVPPGPGEVPLLLGDGRPIATYRPPSPGRGGRVVLGFDPYQGTLLLRPAWPLLVQVLVDDLAPGGPGAPAERVAGQVLTLAPSPWLTGVTVISPSGQGVPPGTVLDEPGLYRVTAHAARAAASGAGEQRAGRAVEAAIWVRPDPRESLAVAQGPRVGAGGTAEPGSASGSVPGSGSGSTAATGSGMKPGGPAGEEPGTGVAGGSAAPVATPPLDHPGWRWAAWLALAGLAAGAWVVRHEL